MKPIVTWLLVLLATLCLSASSQTAQADGLTPAHFRELKEIRRNVLKVRLMIKRDEFDEAEKALDDAEERLDKIAADAGVDETDRAIGGMKKAIAVQRRSLAAQSGDGDESKGGDGDSRVSFTEDVAPILASRCLNCHGNKASGGLRLDTFANMKKGGRSGPLLVVGNYRNSLIFRRLTAPPQQRMPKNGQPLSRDQLQTIALWINQGAKFDGHDQNANLKDLRKAGEDEPMEKKEAPVVIPMATGDESVSFTNDIAPTLVNLCLGCHNNNRSSSGLSVATFKSLMRGGDSGRVILPGNLEGSRLWRLVGGLENPRMPQGQARITRTFYNNLRTWIVEGAKYDGEDPTIPLRELVPTEEEMRAERLANMTPEEWAELRKERTEEQWERVAPREEPESVTSEQFYVYGNVSTARLEQVKDWAEEHVKSIRELFSVKDDRIWKGRLTIFVFRDRFGYTEFNQVIHRRDTAREVTGHSFVSPSQQDAYVVLQDVGDVSGEYSPSLHVGLIDHLTGAFLQRGGTELPNWVLRGTGLALAAKKFGADSEFFQGLKERAIEALTSLQKPEEVFAEGIFSPSDIGPVGYTLVNFMMNAGGAPKFGRFIQQLQAGGKLDTALQAVYGADKKALARSYFASFNK